MTALTKPMSFSDSTTYGYTDKYGKHHGLPNDIIADRFIIIEKLGSGAFGVCYLVFDLHINEYYALKIIKRDPRYTSQAQKEKKILKTLNCLDTSKKLPFVRIIDDMMYEGHQIIVFEELGCNMYDLLYNGGFEGFEIITTHKFTISILKVLEFLAKPSINIIHADLKPENVLLNLTGDNVKVIDFGSSCHKHSKTHTYIQSRYYRAPEIVLGCGYGHPIDMWSLGCMMVEFDTGKPLFKATNETHLIILIVGLLGSPSIDFLKTSKRHSDFFDKDFKLKQFYDKDGKPYSVENRYLLDICKTKDLIFVDFISRCLTWEPTQRMTPVEALEHPFITKRGIVNSPIERFEKSEEPEEFEEFELL